VTEVQGVLAEFT